MTELNANMNRLLDSLDEQPQISVTYFVPDEKKSGGRYGKIGFYGEITEVSAIAFSYQIC